MASSGKRIGIAEIAKLAKVTIGTVDRALHGRAGISESTRQRILEIARRVGYQPNLAARALSVGRKPVRIGISIPREIHYYFDQLRDGIKAEALRAELLGVEAIWEPTERLGAEEIQKVSELVRGDPRVLILTPGSPLELTPLINEAEDRNIRVICVDTDAPSSRRSSVVCTNAEISGSVAAELLGCMVPAGSQVAVITGMLEIEDHRKKTEAFIASFRRFCPSGEVAEIVEGHEDEDEAFQKCFSLLERHDSLAGIYVNTANCLPVCRAIGALGMVGRLRLVATDLFSEMRPYFEKGTISASIYSRPYRQGELAMRMAVDYAVNGTALQKAYYLAPQVVMRSSFHLFREMRSAPPARDLVPTLK
jgi:LacI family transcriptional regulator